MTQRTAALLVGVMGMCAIGVGFVMMELYAHRWVEQVVHSLSEHELEEPFKRLGAKTRLISNRSDHRLSRQLHLQLPSLDKTDGGRLLTLEAPSDAGWAHAWLGAQDTQSDLWTEHYIYFMRKVAAGVSVKRVERVEIPRPHLSGWSYFFALMGLGLWVGLVRLRPSKRSIILGALVFSVAWLGGILHGVYSGLRTMDSLALPHEAMRLGDAILVICAACVPIVIATIVGVLSKGRGSPHRSAYAYLGPAVMSMLLLVFVPFFLGVGLAFTRYVDGTYIWVGIDNFVQILTNEGLGLTHPLSFYFTLGVTVLWTAINVVFHTGLGLGLALVLNRPTLRFKGIYRVLLIIPWAVPSYITALVWHGMFNPTDGFINGCLTAFGVEQIGWFDHFWSAFSANVVTNTWLGFPFMMVVSLGALQSIPRDLYEAAAVDGASKWASFKAITLPLLRPALLPAIILGAVWTFNMFNVIYLVSGGAPSNQTDILITEAYRWAFEKDRYGYASAYSILIFMILLSYGYFTQRLGKSEDGEDAL